MSHEQINEEKLADETNLKKEAIEEEPEKNISDTILIVSVIVLIVILITIFSLKFFIKTEQQTINDMIKLCLKGKLKEDVCYLYKDAYTFVKIEGLWYTQVQNQNLKVGIPLHFNPSHIENTPIIGNINLTLFNEMPYFYITFNPKGNNFSSIALAVGEFDRNMLAAFGKTPIASCIINETDACANRPIINCTNTDEPVVYIKESNETSVILDDNCITIQGQGMDLVKATDRLLLRLYGIM